MPYTYFNQHIQSGILHDIQHAQQPLTVSNSSPNYIKPQRNTSLNLIQDTPTNNDRSSSRMSKQKSGNAVASKSIKKEDSNNGSSEISGQNKHSFN